MPPSSYSDSQRAALVRHAETGEAHCLITHPCSKAILVIPEARAVAAGISVIDAILWSTATAAEDGLDPALLA